MSFEIELKAWVDDREAVERQINTFAVFTADFDKQDVYWFPDSNITGEKNQGGIPLSGVRVRLETLRRPYKTPEISTLITYKTKEVRSGIEINDEKEFIVSSAPIFEELLLRLGLKPGIAKKKQGRSWKYGNVTVEVAEIERLGCFLELEVISNNDSPETVEAARNSLYGLLKKTGISEDRIETRYYNDMLKELISMPA
jgi:adenylate cyclase class 2